MVSTISHNLNVTDAFGKAYKFLLYDVVRCCTISPCLFQRRLTKERYHWFEVSVLWLTVSGKVLAANKQEDMIYSFAKNDLSPIFEEEVTKMIEFYSIDHTHGYTQPVLKCDYDALLNGEIDIDKCRENAVVYMRALVNVLKPKIVTVNV